MATIDYSTSITTLEGEEQTMEIYRGRVLLIVNTASKCLLTPQFEGLQDLHDEFGPKGFSVLGFPCNQFRDQELDSADAIGGFCQRNYGVTFPMHAVVKVNGRGAHPLFKQLTAAKRSAVGMRRIEWNFAKFLVGRDGEILRRFPAVVGADGMKKAIVKALGN